MHQPVVTDSACGLRVNRAVHEDCRGSIAIILASSSPPALMDRDARPGGSGSSRRSRGKGGGTRAAVVELVARCAGAWVEVRMVREE